MKGFKQTGRIGVPITEHPGKMPATQYSNEKKSHVKTEAPPRNTANKKKAPPAPKLSPLEEWKAGRARAVGDPAWNVYDSFIKKIVGEINQHLSTSKQISHYQPLDWKWIKAMIWTETGATHPAWKTRPIQIGNPRDKGIREVVVPVRKIKYHLIVPADWDKYLINQTAMIISNPEYNIRAGVAFLMIKMAYPEKSRTVYESDNIYVYEVVKGDKGDDDIAKREGTTRGVLSALNGDGKIIHSGDKLKFKKARVEQYIPEWFLFTANEIQEKYNGNPNMSTLENPGDKNYADKIKFSYDIISSGDKKN